MNEVPATGGGDEAAAGGPRIADILVPVALDTAYSYAVPDDLDLAAGDVVVVPFGPRETVGVVWALREGTGANLKRVVARFDVPPFTAAMRRFLDWIAWYTVAPRGLAMRLALRLPAPDRAEAVRIGVRLAGPPPERLTPGRARVIAAAEGGLVFTRRELAERAAVSQAVVDGLVDAGTLETIALPPEPVAPPPDTEHARSALSPAQERAAAALRATMRGGGFSVTLVEGVTGSGKTEVYFEAVAEALRQGRQALILMPEIALTAQFLDRFAARFGVRPAEWHSGVPGRRRERIHAGVASGEVKVVAGARSALFLPFRDPGLIVVDEEHEGAYKQEDGVHYHARDMAIVRGRIERFPVVLASATPSIETRVNAARGRYAHLHLPERFGGRSLPDIDAIDLRRDPAEPGRWLSPPLVRAVRETVGGREQALLFLNRRGYAPLTLCRACGHRFQCPNCSAWLVEHRFRRALVCHHCGHVERRPEACPACGGLDVLAACGPGVERLAEEVAELFPDCRSIVLSSDFPGGTERLRAELKAIAEGEVDIVIGTQLVAKGHNFPQLTLVGVVDADVGLANGDPRAAERTFQLLQQVTGRAGRGEKPGRALIQTYQPEHPVLKALVSGDAERFYREETAQREAAGLPPFGRLAGIVVAAADRAEAETHARALARAAAAPPGIDVLGPAEAPLALVRGRYRFRLLVRGTRDADLQGFLRSWMTRAPKPPARIRVTIDVDPMSFM
ncbi:primosomal protein N' [Chelatococcus sp. SYSU_G07232]|uniref:Replication restart protein PriA n=1 Tax=Chelatococcus albus TaxID=3047466 RepID=A0ABT7ADA5_9HYPH|nr:primosomal protein N' [Chelatococcus sp. SYSU_G07232]MDJ1157367.1 primosomal protein N' [Chelatococcus sp. SYSU_G07232]